MAHLKSRLDGIEYIFRITLDGRPHVYETIMPLMEYARLTYEYEGLNQLTNGTNAYIFLIASILYDYSSFNPEHRFGDWTSIILDRLGYL